MALHAGWVEDARRTRSQQEEEGKGKENQNKPSIHDERERETKTQRKSAKYVSAPGINTPLGVFSPAEYLFLLVSSFFPSSIYSKTSS